MQMNLNIKHPDALQYKCLSTQRCATKRAENVWKMRRRKRRIVKLKNQGNSKPAIGSGKRERRETSEKDQNIARGEKEVSDELPDGNKDLQFRERANGGRRYDSKIRDNNREESINFNLSPIDWNSEVSFERCEATYEDFSFKFKCPERNFNHQYAHIYANRLNSMQSIIRNKCIAKWGKEIRIRKLSELAELKNERCIVIGTLFKHQDLKPSILKEISDENQLVPQPKIKNYVSPTDQLILEDEIQRIRLIGNIDINKLVTGIVVAVLGMQNEDGNFEVEDHTFANVYEEISAPAIYEDDARYMLMVSGLNIDGTSDLLPMQLLKDWICGELGSITDQIMQSKICKVVIVGNSIKGSRHIPGTRLLSSEPDENSDILASIKLLDRLLSDFARSIEVDIMPGEFDPSNHTLPQQPMHSCIFPRCSVYKTFRRVTNPYEFILQDRRVLGTSGQPINDIKSLTNTPTNLSILENTLLWNHLAPTAPDTLACYPYYEEDPFIITDQPDIYFTGNVSAFETKLIKMNGYPVRLVCLPSFAETQTCALLNLKTLECHPLSFKIFHEFD